MKIQRLSYGDLDSGWEFDGLTFLPDVSLLVGASGVGKTRTLKAIRKLRAIATGNEGASNWGINWSTDFTDLQGTSYHWHGAFEGRGLVDSDNDGEAESAFGIDDFERKRPKIVREKFQVNGNVVFERNEESFILGGERLPAKLSPHVSGLSILSEEDNVKPAKHAISQMLVVDASEDLDNPHSFIHGNYRLLHKRHTELSEIRALNLPTSIKLALVYAHEPSVFQEIVEAFREVFPYIEDVKVEETRFPPFGDRPVIMLREAGTRKYFAQDELSAGMRRTLMHLARLALWPEGTLILIDEFENSLGANCIDIVSSGLLTHGKSLQFIITSHHPFIINSIPMTHWKIIARDKGQIKFFTTAELKVGRSRQEAFTQLINTDVFKYGTLPK